jgi:hypothetical protein
MHPDSVLAKALDSVTHIVLVSIHDSRINVTFTLWKQLENA